MKTKTEIKKRARAFAEMHFYADIDGNQLWEPFEHYPTAWIKKEIADMSKMLAQNMLWAQENS